MWVTWSTHVCGTYLYMRLNIIQHLQRLHFLRMHLAILLALESQNVVNAYLRIKQLFPFVFARHNNKEYSHSVAWCYVVGGTCPPWDRHQNPSSCSVPRRENHVVEVVPRRRSCDVRTAHPPHPRRSGKLATVWYCRWEAAAPLPSRCPGGQLQTGSRGTAAAGNDPPP